MCVCVCVCVCADPFAGPLNIAAPSFLCSPPLPAFLRKQSRFDLTTFGGRVRHFYTITDPRTLFKGESDVRRFFPLSPFAWASSAPRCAALCPPPALARALSCLCAPHPPRPRLRDGCSWAPDEGTRVRSLLPSLSFPKCLTLSPSALSRSPVDLPAQPPSHLFINLAFERPFASLRRLLSEGKENSRLCDCTIAQRRAPHNADCVHPRPHTHHQHSVLN